MKLSNLLNNFDIQTAYLLGLIYSWPMISKDKS
jgi:hypothetical protein